MHPDRPLADLSIAVIGAGIGGLATALTLRRLGARVTVLEQAPAITEVGAGLQISPNGMVVLDALGLAPALDSAPRARAMSLRDFRTGKEVLRLDLAARARDHRFVHRADLVDVLAGAARAAGVQVKLLQKVADVVPGPRPRVALVHGDTFEADLVIGADGLHSVVRGALGAAPAATFTGHVAWRAVVPNVTAHPAEARVHMGPGGHVVSYPLRGGDVVNLVAVEERRTWTEESWSRTGNGDAMRGTFSHFGGDVARLMAEVDAPGLWGLFRHRVAPRWHAEGV
ncbi:FAD-dependent monooxygenase, partial [Roseivivax isoporae]